MVPPTVELIGPLLRGIGGFFLYDRKFGGSSYHTKSPAGRDAHAAQKKRLIKAAARRREKTGKPLMIEGGRGAAAGTARRDGEKREKDKNRV